MIVFRIQTADFTGDGFSCFCPTRELAAVRAAAIAKSSGRPVYVDRLTFPNDPPGICAALELAGSDRAAWPGRFERVVWPDLDPEPVEKGPDR